MVEVDYSNVQQYALTELASIPRKDHEPVFNEPWEAEVFSMVISLHSQELFTWKEWTDCLTPIIKESESGVNNTELPDSYYMPWLQALEHMVVKKKLGDFQQLEKLQNAWSDAADSTPHGQPIELDLTITKSILT